MRATVYKSWRVDLDLWEEKIKLFRFIVIYRYSIWRDGATHTHLRLRARPGADYLRSARVTRIRINRKEFEQVYNGNKWIVPVGYEIDDE
jgi:hypothetical protein